jgi:hypothetical protein
MVMKYAIILGKPLPFDKETKDRAVALDNSNETALVNLFTQTFPKNSLKTEIIPKVCTLNVLYNTNIYYIDSVVEHIWHLNVDQKLKDDNLNLVNELSKVKVFPKGTLESKIINYYSFASKYCSFHKPNVYPIYDSKVDRVLRYFRDVDEFAEFKDSELKSYEVFKRTVDQFKDHYEFSKFYTYKQLDSCFLWLYDQYWPES